MVGQHTCYSVCGGQKTMFKRASCPLCWSQGSNIGSQVKCVLRQVSNYFLETGSHTTKALNFPNWLRMTLNLWPSCLSAERSTGETSMHNLFLSDAKDQTYCLVHARRAFYQLRPVDFWTVSYSTGLIDLLLLSLCSQEDFEFMTILLSLPP